MAKKQKHKFVLVDLSDDKAKELSEVISSSTSRRILDHLSSVEKVSESEISKNLRIAASTVHYHISKLVEAGLVESVGFTYSSRGRKVEHYALANQYIIIAPKKKDIAGLAQKLKSILPALGISAIVGGLAQWISSVLSKGGEVMYDSSAALMRAVPESLVLEESAKTATDEIVQEAALEMMIEAPPIAYGAAETVHQGLTFPWVFVLVVCGAILGIGTYLLWQRWKK